MSYFLNKIKNKFFEPKIITEQYKKELFMEELKHMGHKCIEIGESYPIQVFWCGENPCRSTDKIKSDNDKLLEKLRNEGHDCIGVMYDLVNKEEKIKWCENTPCLNITLEKQTKILIEKGHSCVKYGYNSNNKQILIWCNNESSCNNNRSYNDNWYDKSYDIIPEGHTCVRILETIPPRISWCHQDICKNNTQKEVLKE